MDLAKSNSVRPTQNELGPEDGISVRVNAFPLDAAQRVSTRCTVLKMQPLPLPNDFFIYLEISENMTYRRLLIYFIHVVAEYIPINSLQILADFLHHCQAEAFWKFSHQV